ncbi:MAG TPA: Wzy polymerase domain-containing protein [Burkholderiales bacterium]|nr:Wzy polymerase domain-containing protein [Burkholderiales bacterium]
MQPAAPEPRVASRAARASLALLGLAWTLPFLQPYHRFPLTSFYSEWLALAAGLAAALYLATRRAWQDAALPAVAAAPLALGAVLALQAALGLVPYAEQALTAGLYLVWAALLIVLGRALARALGLAEIAAVLAWCTLAGGAAGALAGLLQHYSISTPLDFLIARKAAAAVYGNLGQANHFAAYTALALSSTAYLHALGRLRGAPAAACAALLLFALALAGSRAPWLYLGAAAALALLLYARLRDAASRRLAAFAAALLPGFVLAQWLAALPLLAPQDGALVTSAQRLFQVASGIEPRLQLAREAWAMFLSAPLLGAGWGQFAWHHFLHQALTGEGAAPGVFNHAHNAVLQLLAETGLAGALPVLAALLHWLAGLGRSAPGLHLWWLLAGLAVIAIHSLLEFPLWYSYFLGIAAVLLGAGARDAIRLRLAGAARLVAAAALALGALNLAAVLPAYRGFERLVFLPAGAAARAVDEAAFAKAIAAIHREPLLAPYVELAVAYGLAVSEERLREKLELSTRALRFAPVEVVAYRHALLLAAAGERAAALEQLERAARVYPAALEGVVEELRALARERPHAFGPLLDWARARGAGRHRRAAE